MKNETPKIKDTARPEIKAEEINTVGLSTEFEAPEPIRVRHVEPELEPAAVAVIDSIPGAGAGMPPAAFWAQLIETLRNNKEVDQRQAADLHAYAMRKALRPEEPSPQISVYNPLGDVDHPRPKPKCAYWLRSFPICDPGDYATVTYTELELLDQIRPGVYPVTKSDGSVVKLAVIAEYDSSGTKLTKVILDLPIGDEEQKSNWPPLVQLLTEAITGESPAHSAERMLKRIADLEAQLAASAA